MATDRCCLSGRNRQVLSLWWLQTGAVSLVATERCCLSGRYKQVLSLWWLQTGAVCLVATDRRYLSISHKLLHTLSQPKIQRDKRIVLFTVPNKWHLFQTNPLAADTTCCLLYKAINICGFPKFEGTYCIKLEVAGKEEAAKKSANFGTDLPQPRERHCQDLQT